MQQPSEYVYTIPPAASMVLLLVWNLLMPIIAILLGRKAPKARPLFHLIALGFIAASPFLYMRFCLAPEDAEMPGPLDGIALLPFLLEGFLIVVAYIIYGAFRVCIMLRKLVERRREQIDDRPERVSIGAQY